MLSISFLLLTIFVSASLAASGNGYASCYGNYRDVLVPASQVSSGLGSFIQGESFTYTTAICSNWANSFAGACFEVQCTGGSGTSGGMRCNQNAQRTFVRVIDTLGNDCSGNPQHTFDLNDVPFDQLGTDGQSCSGKMGISFSSVSCQTAGIVSGGIKIGLPPNQVDPWCPSFLFSNVGGSGAIHSVSVSPNGGANWYPYTRNSFNGARWDCNQGSGSYLGKSLSFRMTSCAIDGVPNQCNPADTITLTNALPSNWCGANGVPCNSGSFQASSNFGNGGQLPPPPPTQQPPPPPTQQPPPPPTQPPQGSAPTTRCGPSWVTANSNCGRACNSNDDCSGQTCYADLDAAPCAGQQPPPPPPVVTPPPPPPVVTPPPPQQTPPPKPRGSGTVRCGADWTKANSDCLSSCVTNNDCSSGTFCFAGLSEVPCAGNPPPPPVVNPPPPPPPVVIPPPPPPVVNPPPPAQQGSGTVRCGADWGSANSNCGRSCSTDGDCPSGQFCYNSLNEAPCGSVVTNPPPPPPTNLQLPPTTGAGCGFLVTEDHLRSIMERPGADLSALVAPLNYALRKNQMDCPNRVTAFLAQVRHETAGLTTFYQPLDNGAGAIHMVASNWAPMCEQVSEIRQMFADKFPNCGNCECIAAMAANPMGPDTTRAAKEILSAPLAAFLSGTWWFVSGSSTPALLGWKGCGDLRLNSDVGLGGPGSGDCKHNGYYQVSCCVFGSINEAGFAQRLRYYDLARSVIPGASRAIADNDSLNAPSNTQSSSSSLSTVHIAAIAGTGGLVVIIVVIIVVVFAAKSNQKRREESV